MYKCINGWTKEKMLGHIKQEFKGKSVGFDRDYGDLCLYRNPEGKKCAVGMFIPTSIVLDRAFNRTAVSKLLRHYPEIRYAMPLGLEGLERLQYRHDNAENDKECLEAMLDFITNQVQDGVP